MLIFPPLDNPKNLTGLLRLEACELHHLRPLFGFPCDKVGELGGGSGKWFTANISHSRLHHRISERRVDLLVKPLDDVGRGSFRNADAEPSGYDVARDNIANQRNVEQHAYALSACYP